MKPIYLLFLLVLFSCKKDMVLPESSLSTIFGKWNWVSSSGGFAGLVVTPKTVGFEKSLEFNKDGTFKLFENQEKVGRGTYRFAKRHSNFSNDSAFILIMAYHSLNNEPTNAMPMVVQFPLEKTLFLIEECSDCFSHVYKKEE